MKILKILTPVLLVLVLSGSCARPPSDEWDLVDSETWQNQVKLSLQVQRDTLKPGDVLNLRVQVENLTNSEVKYTMWNLGDPPVYTRIQQPYGQPVTLRLPSDPEVVLPAVSTGILKPKEIIKRELQWDGKVSLDSTTIQAPDGTYEVEAVFFPGVLTDQTEPDSLLVSHRVQVIESTTLIPPEEAQQKAMAHPSVKRWLDAHTGQAVAREEKGSYSVNVGGNWESTSKEVYDDALKSPYSSTIHYSSNQWLVNFASKFGFPPPEITVAINAETGQTVSVSPDLEAELKGGVVATFKVGEFIFHAFVTNQDTISELFRLQQGTSSAKIPVGALLPGPGAALHNAPWSWHLDPQNIQMAEFTIELCDGTPGFVESELSYWLGTVKSYCPWSAELVEIKDYR